MKKTMMMMKTNIIVCYNKTRILGTLYLACQRIATKLNQKLEK